MSHRMTMHRIAGHAGLAAILTVLGGVIGGIAAAEPLPAEEPMPVTIKQPLKLMLCDRGGEAEIKLHRNFFTTIYVPKRPKKVYTADKEDRFTFWIDETFLRVRPNTNALPGEQSSFELIIGDRWLTVRILVVDDPADVDLRWDLELAGRGACVTRKTLSPLDLCKLDLGEKDKKQVELQARLLRTTQERDEARAKLAELAAQHEREQLALASRGRERVLLDESVRGHRTVPIENWVPAPNSVLVHAQRWELFDNAVLLRMELENTERHAYPITEIQLFDEHGKEQTGLVKIAGMAEEPVEKGQTLATIAVGARVPVAIWVSEPAMLGRHVSLMMRGAQGTKPVMQERIPTWDFRTPPHPNEGYTTVYVKGLVGALSVRDDAAQGQKATWVVGGGVRLTQGLLKRLDVDTELNYLESGEARFMTVQGELTQRSRTIRAQFGGLLHFGDTGDTYRPAIRLGVGMYGASVQRKVGGSDESSIEFDLTFNVGLGLNVHLSENGRAGVMLSLDGPPSGNLRTFEAGVYLGYGRAREKKQ